MGEEKIEEIKNVVAQKEKGLLFRKYKKVIVGASMMSVLVVASIGVLGFQYLNKFDVKEKKVTLELGKTLSKKAADYIVATERVIEDTKIDFSKIDMNVVGTYEAIASYKDKKIVFEIIVQDTTAPEVVTNENVSVIVGKELVLTTVVQSITDLSELKSIVLDTNQIDIATESELVTDRIGLKFDTVGLQTVTLTVIDKYDNTAMKDFTVNVIEDYETHVMGIQDITLEQGSTVDMLANVVKDDKIMEIRVNVEGVDINTAGQYKAIYTIIGDDAVTTIDKEITITVVEPIKAQQMANSGSVVQVTGGVKQKQQVASSNKKVSNSNNNSGGSSSSNDGSSNKSSNGGNSVANDNGSASAGGGSVNKPSNGGGSDFVGDSWSGSTTDKGTTTDGGVDYESGTWNPWG